MVVAILIWVKDLNGLSSCVLYLSCVASWEVEDTKYGGKGRGIGWSLESSGKSVWCWKTTILLQCQGNWASQSEHSGFIAETDTFKTNYIIAALLKWFMDIRMLLSGIATTYYSIIDGTPNDVILCQQSESMWIKVRKKIWPSIYCKKPWSSNWEHLAPSYFSHHLGLYLTDEVRRDFLSETKSTAESVKMPAICRCV